MANYPEKEILKRPNLQAPIQGVSYVGGGHIVEKGQKLAKGTLVGKSKTSGKLKLMDSKDADLFLYGIASEDVDATAEDKTSYIYYTGGFNKKSLIVGKGDDVMNYYDAAKAIGLFFRNSIMEG